MQTLLPPGWPRPRGYANGVTARGRMVFVAGMIGWDAQGVFHTDDLAGQVRQALQNTLKLSLLFLCSLARGEAAGSGDAQQPAPTGGKRGGKKAKGSAGAGEAAAGSN